MWRNIVRFLARAWAVLRGHSTAREESLVNMYLDLLAKLDRCDKERVAAQERLMAEEDRWNLREEELLKLRGEINR